MASGSVLLAVFSSLIITTAAMSREHGEIQQARTRMMRSCQLAESGIAMAAHPLGLNGAPSKSLKEAAAILGIAGSDTSFLTLSGPTRHVESIGRAGDAQCGIVLALYLKDGMPRMVEWLEFSVKGAGLP